MDDETLGKIEKALNILTSTPIKPKAKGKNSLYALIVRKGFNTITQLLKEGLNFNELFDHFVECDVLSENGNPESLRRAYNREKAIRIRKKEQSNYEIQEQKADSTSVPALASTTVPVTEQAENENNANVDKIRQKLMGTAVGTGTSRIVRRTDGGFDFDK